MRSGPPNLSVSITPDPFNIVVTFIAGDKYGTMAFQEILKASNTFGVPRTLVDQVSMGHPATNRLGLQDKYEVRLGG